MKADNNLLFDDAGAPVPFEASPNIGGEMTPSYLIMHYTAGASAESSIRTLVRPGAKVSAHLVIGRDGAVTQLVPFNKVAWHAGTSRWQGLKGLNRHSIGIELDNAGVLNGGPGNWKSWFGRTYADSDVVVAAHKHEGVTRGWHSYPEAQITAALEVCEAIFDAYPLLDILGHDDIAPERKQDPGPAFPLENFRSRLVGRADDDFPVMETTANVNLREGPGVEYAKVRPNALPKGTRIEVETRDASWLFGDVLDENGDETDSGWVHGNYVKPAPPATGNGA